MKLKEVFKFSILTSMIVAGGVIINKKKIEKSKQCSDDMIKTLSKNYDLSCKFLDLKISKKSIEDFFLEYSYKNIALYGIGNIGKLLSKELEESSIIIKYYIDNAVSGKLNGIPIYSSDDELPEVDAIVVIPIYAYDQIEKQLSEKVNCDIVSLEHIIYEVKVL